MGRQNKLHVRPRRTREGHYVSAAHPSAWRHAPIVKFSFTVWSIMATTMGVVLGAAGLMALVGAVVLTALALFF